MLDAQAKLNTSVGGSLALFHHCLAPAGLHTHPGIEAAFLQLFKSWEMYLEETLIAALCGHTPVTGSVMPFFTVNDAELARKIILQNKPFMEWSVPEDVLKRCGLYLDAGSVVITRLSTVVSQLKEMQTIRNHIAHSSFSAREKFTKLIAVKFGGKPPIASSAEFLLEIVPGEGVTYFEYYANALLITSSEIVV